MSWLSAVNASRASASHRARASWGKPSWSATITWAVRTRAVTGPRARTVEGWRPGWPRAISPNVIPGVSRVRRTRRLPVPCPESSTVPETIT